MEEVIKELKSEIVTLKNGRVNNSSQLYQV
jgi:hypothetical protein